MQKTDTVKVKQEIDHYGGMTGTVRKVHKENVIVYLESADEPRELPFKKDELEDS